MGPQLPRGGLLGRAKGKKGGRQQSLCRRNLSPTGDGRDALLLPLRWEVVCPQGRGYGGCAGRPGILRGAGGAPVLAAAALGA